MAISLSEAELRVMNVVWRLGGEVPAAQIHEQLTSEAGCSKPTTYSLIHRCIEKGALARREPGFVCHALVAQEDVQATEAERFIDRVFEGSAERLLATLVKRNKISLEEIDKLRKIVDKSK